ncbi:hypothetical protein DESC_600010 [Desulfosarcina cetonica]|nr:hypothetical protein DESC_600010 [Desulfosarcina cetonica]
MNWYSSCISYPFRMASISFTMHSTRLLSFLPRYDSILHNARSGQRLVKDDLFIFSYDPDDDFHYGFTMVDGADEYAAIFDDFFSGWAPAIPLGGETRRRS